MVISNAEIERDSDNADPTPVPNASPDAAAALKALLTDLTTAGERADSVLKDKKAAADYALSAANNEGQITQSELHRALMEWAHARGYAEGYLETLRIVAERFGVGDLLSGRSDASASASANSWGDPALNMPAPMPRAERRRYAKRKKSGKRGKA